MPIDIALGQVTEERQYSQTYDDYIEQTAEKMRDTHQLAREQLSSTADQRKDDYDLKVKRKSFKRGDWCYY